MKFLTRAAAALSAFAILATGCASTAAAQKDHVPADVEFMRNMIAHHAQALEMTSLVSTRTKREDISLLAERITVSQKSETDLMRSWLETRDEAIEDTTSHHHHADMPGMLSEEDMRKLAAASGEEFERLFIDLMIRHHEGALLMLEELFSHPGAGQGPEIFQIASHIDSDQRAEIARMRRMSTATLPRGSE